MAGGKLSARQKMINMMYLVLTALLALNVSAEILDAFDSLRASLKSSAETFAEKNMDTKGQILDKVQEEMSTGNIKNQGLIKLAGDVEKETNVVINYLNELTDSLNSIAEWDELIKEYHNIKETELNFQYWMGAGKDQMNNGRGDGAAIRLKAKLDDFVKFARDFIAANDTGGTSRIKFSEIAIDPENDPRVSESNPGKNTPWEYYTFHSKPVIADLAMMEKFKLDVQGVHSELLNFIKAKLGAVKFKIDSLILVDAPTSRVVAAGMKFETKLFVAATSKDAVPEFSGSGSVRSTDGGYAAMMSMTASGGFGKGQNEKEASYNATAVISDASGGKQSLRLS
ncbi:MAG TPA: hypothetical protein ENJ82_08585, partial [Bacteroidetes bacterium]|nr:hypothetical protein [Bacteroidota bacterium]